MNRSSIGGRANWSGAAFELRLGVELCVYILLGENAGLAPGAPRCVQLQAPEPVDDLVLEFEGGARWAIQAKAGPSVRVEWGAERPFGKALRQLYRGASRDQVQVAPDSLDRVELAVDFRAHPSLTAFARWLSKTRQHREWERFVEACSGEELDWARRLPALLEAAADDALLAFLRQCYVRLTPAPDALLAFLRQCYVRLTPAPDQWWGDLRGRLIVAGCRPVTRRRPFWACC